MSLKSSQNNIQIPDFVTKKLLPTEKCLKIFEKIYSEFARKYPQYMQAGEQALAERLINRIGTDYSFLQGLNALQLLSFAKLYEVKIGNWSETERNELNETYQKYIKPIKDRNESEKISKAIIHYLTYTSPNSNEWKNRELGNVDNTFAYMAELMRRNPNIKNALSKLIKRTGLIENYGGTARILLSQSTPDKLKTTKAKIMMIKLIKEKPKELNNLFNIDNELI